MTTALSKTGERRLAEAEAAIERGLSTFWEVGEALMRIRDERLYRADFSTFEDYCQSRWNMTRRRANQLVEAAQMGTVVPIENERQARALAPVKEDPVEVREIFAEAERRGDTTGAGISRVIAERHPRPSEKPDDVSHVGHVDERPSPTVQNRTVDSPASPPPTAAEQYRIALRTALNDALKITTQFPDHEHNLEVQAQDRDIFLSDLRSLSRWIDDALNAADGVALRAVK